MTNVTTTASALRAGDFLHRVTKTAGRTRVFESAINAEVLSVEVRPEHPEYLRVSLVDGFNTVLNLEHEREVTIVVEDEEPTTPLAEQTPIEIDTQIAEIVADYYEIRRPLAHLAQRIEDAAIDLVHGDSYGVLKREGLIGSGRMVKALRARLTQEVLRDLQDASEAGVDPSVWRKQKRVLDAHEAYEDCIQRSESRYADIEPFEDEYNRRGGWSRFFLVTSSKGHIHASRNCSTCTHTTTYAWLPTVSGKTEKDAVEEHGPLLCSVCFPTAPVEWTPEGYVDPSVCTGSGSFFSRDLPHRTGYYTGNWGTCEGCNSKQTITSTGKFRKHKKEA